MKRAVLVRSLSVCFLVAALMAGAGFCLLGGLAQEGLSGGKVEAVNYKQEFEQNTDLGKATVGKDIEEGNIEAEPKSAKPEPELEPEAKPESEAKSEAATEENKEEDLASSPVEEKTVPEVSAQEIIETATPVETASEKPAASPSINVEPAVKAEKVITSAPASFSWGQTNDYNFRTEVKVTNNGSSPSKNVTVSVPLLENNSSYQTTTLLSVNYDVISNSGRVSTFNLGDLAPGESKTIIADFKVSLRTVSLNSSNDTIDKARKAYDLFAGEGNCRELARAFISKCHEMGINAREVVGYARPRRGAMTAGSLEGCRHSWAEFYDDSLGWVPVDLTFQYFGGFPQTSHVVESYGDQSIKVNFTGGNLSASWSNSVH